MLVTGYPRSPNCPRRRAIAIPHARRLCAAAGTVPSPFLDGRKSAASTTCTKVRSCKHVSDRIPTIAKLPAPSRHRNPTRSQTVRGSWHSPITVSVEIFRRWGAPKWRYISGSAPIIATQKDVASRAELEPRPAFWSWRHNFLPWRISRSPLVLVVPMCDDSKNTRLPWLRVKVEAVEHYCGGNRDADIAADARALWPEPCFAPGRAPVGTGKGTLPRPVALTGSGMGLAASLY